MATALIIDDNRQTADALAQMLEVLGFETQLAYGPSSGMVLLGNLLPDLILLDINMPGIDGLEVLAYLRREPRLNTVPVIIVTSDDQPETRRRAFQVGAQGFILKPVTLDVIEAELKRLGMAN
ncbi:MAG: PleD family two-component system response regulator [Anaerolineales bacterium]